jgi:uncharacterized protein
MDNLRQKYAALLGIVARTPGAVAFSGGVDSSLLLKACFDTFGAGSIAFFADSILQTEADRVNAVQTAGQIGVTLQVVDIFPLLQPEFLANPPERCYHCKKTVYQHFNRLLPGKGMILYDGSNLDDLSAERPGRKAIAELGVATPLIEAGLDKSDIRQLARYLNLPTWDRESSSCLATRIPTGTEISEINLALVATYEQILFGLGFVGCRVRLSAENLPMVKVEVKDGDIARAAQQEIRGKIRASFENVGITEVLLSLKGR